MALAPRYRVGRVIARSEVVRRDSTGRLPPARRLGGRQAHAQEVKPNATGPATFSTPFATTGRPVADKGRRIEKVNRPRPAGRVSGCWAGLAAATTGLDRPAGIGLILGWGALAGVASSGSTDSGVTARLFGTFLTWLNDRTSDSYVICTCNDISKLPPEFSRSGAVRRDLVPGPARPPAEGRDLGHLPEDVRVGRRTSHGPRMTSGRVPR